jgi:signal transduction histidine kinase
VIQEAITNAFRHAPGAAIRIELTGGPEFTIEVTNDPPLLPATVPSLVDRHAEPDRDSPGTWGSGRGLIGIRERVIGVGGEVTWGATSSGGWQVLARFPLRDRR